MGDADSESPRKLLNYENIEPEEKYGGDKDGLPLTFKYPVLDKVIDGKIFSNSLMTDEMRTYLTRKGDVIVDPESQEGKRLFQWLNDSLNESLEVYGKQVEVGIGTPIIVERGGDSDPRRKTNIIFCLVRDRNESLPAGERYYFFAHPVDIDENGVPIASTQKRGDTEDFQPPLWPVQPGYPFGYRDVFPHIVSYPVKDVK